MVNSTRQEDNTAGVEPVVTQQALEGHSKAQGQVQQELSSGPIMHWFNELQHQGCPQADIPQACEIRAAEISSCSSWDVEYPEGDGNAAQYAGNASNSCELTALLHAGSGNTHTDGSCIACHNS